jgi:hypothetical protein
VPRRGRRETGEREKVRLKKQYRHSSNRSMKQTQPNDREDWSSGSKENWFCGWKKTVVVVTEKTFKYGWLNI